MTFIVAAALRVDDLILVVETPGRHHDIFFSAHKNVVAVPGAEQGFITSQGRFVDRKEARQIAQAASQINGKAHSPEFLYSEDLW